MGLSRNKVAVSEGAAGSPPFYGECEISLTDISYLQIGKTKTKKRKDDEEEVLYSKGNRKSSCCSILSDRCHLVKNDTQTNGGVAQLGEHLPCKQGVMGSIPIISTRGT